MSILYYIRIQIFPFTSLNINLQTDWNFPWSWSPPTTMSTVEIALLSDSFEIFWQNKISCDVVKNFVIYFVQKWILFPLKNKKIALWNNMVLSKLINTIFRSYQPCTKESWLISQHNSLRFVRNIWFQSHYSSSIMIHLFG